MPSRSSGPDTATDPWDRRYSGAGATGVSWYQPEPAMSLTLIDRLRVAKEAPVIDVGGGASPLVDRLVGRGYTDLTVLDVSSTALEIARRRLDDTVHVRWLHENLMTWEPQRRYALWHDRAVFHFLTNAGERAKYLTTMRHALSSSLSRGSLPIACQSPRYGPPRKDRRPGPAPRRSGSSSSCRSKPCSRSARRQWRRPVQPPQVQPHPRHPA